MARGSSRTELEVEWQALAKDWYSIYQWGPTSREGYTEWIAAWAVASFGSIGLVADGLRTRSFKVADHRGQIELSTGIEQLTEKRLVRAMRNSGTLPALGRVVDYEIPLKETDDARHGDIDLLCAPPSDDVLCVEAKQPSSKESLLKGVLQAYTYTSLVARRKASFLDDFGLNKGARLAPAVLTFSGARSGQQLLSLGKYPHLLALIRRLNEDLALAGNGALRFFVVTNGEEQLERCLVEQKAGGDTTVAFRDGFALSVDERPLPASVTGSPPPRPVG